MLGVDDRPPRKGKSKKKSKSKKKKKPAADADDGEDTEEADDDGGDGDRDSTWKNKIPPTHPTTDVSAASDYLLVTHFLLILLPNAPVWLLIIWCVVMYCAVEEKDGETARLYRADRR